MPIKARVLIDNVVYHIIVRGNHGQTIFSHQDDFVRYLKTVRKYKNRYGFRLYAYCLMNNHVHLVIDPHDKYSLKNIMHCINLSYCKWHNSRYEQSGHLWQGRYKSYIVQKDQYLVNCITYVEFNPVRAKICQRAEEYPWSSYSSRTLGVPSPLLDDILF
ncbi:MAG: transposase [Candidatus Omnitrophica bacterium]|nr:transposase [Candidatus Omnitrophota bacterium]MDD5487763.1 transposase [Candidatus Omnitrophota bacterium]